MRSRTTTAVVLMIAASGCAGGTPPYVPETSESTVRNGGTVTVPVLTEAGTVPADAQAAVVKVLVDLCDGRATGSGFLIGARTVITNRHVVDGAVSVALSNSERRAKVVAVDVANGADLARLTLDTDLPGWLHLATSDPTSGDEVSLVGFPRGGGRTVTSGRIVGEDAEDAFGGRATLTTSAVIEPGNSGGPALADDGQVVGVATAINLRDELARLIPVSEVNHARWTERRLETC